MQWRIVFFFNFWSASKDSKRSNGRYYETENIYIENLEIRNRHKIKECVNNTRQHKEINSPEDWSIAGATWWTNSMCLCLYMCVCLYVCGVVVGQLLKRVRQRERESETERRQDVGHGHGGYWSEQRNRSWTKRFAEKCTKNSDRALLYSRKLDAKFGTLSTHKNRTTKSFKQIRIKIKSKT